METRKSAGITAGLLLSLLAANAHSAVVIQEVLYDGEGTDPDDVFTELFGAPGTVLDGWSLVGINGSNGEVYRTVDLGGSVIPADGIFVIATGSANAPLATVTDLVANVDWQNGPDAIQLWHGELLIDALQYGDAGVFNAGEGMFAADISGNFSLSRDAFGTDTGDNSIDFSTGLPTPGSGPAVVPVPAAGWLFGSSMLSMLFARRRRSRKQ